MAIVTVKYSMEVTEVLEWPDNELDLLTYENLECNLNSGMRQREEIELGSITSAEVDGQELEF